MDTVELEPEQALAIFSMVFAATAVDREPMASTLKFLNRAQRERLAGLRLIELSSERRGGRKADYLKLTDEGWHWASEHLDAPVPPLAHAANVLHAVLRKLQAHLRSSTESLSSIATAAVAESRRSSTKAASRNGRSTSAKRQKTKLAEQNAQSIGRKSKGTEHRVGTSTPKSIAAERKTKSAPKKANAAENKAKPATRRAKTTERKAKSAKKRSNTAENRAKPAKKGKPSTTKPRGYDSRMKPSLSAAAALDTTLMTAPQATQHYVANGGALGERVRRACLELAGGMARRRVRLHELRSRLSDVSRERLDRELLELQRAEKVVLYRIDDPTDVAVEDESAALQVAGLSHHIVYLEQ